MYNEKYVTITCSCFSKGALLLMRISYKKLKILMMENQMKRADLVRAAELTSYAAKKINKDEIVSLEVLMRICKVFHCDIGDICEVILDE